MNIARIVSILSLSVFVFFAACSNVAEDDPIAAETSQNTTDPEVSGADVAFAQQFVGTYNGYCCQHTASNDGNSESTNYEASNEVTLSGENNSNILIDGELFFHVSGRDIATEDIKYRSNEGYGAEATFRKEATILEKNTNFSTPTESGYINCDTYR